MSQNENKKKQIIILRHNGGRLGNQLLLYLSVYAFCLEYGYKCINYTFYNYRDLFNFPNGDRFTSIISLLSRLKLYNTHRDYVIIYKIYTLLTYLYVFFRKGMIIKEDPKFIIYLPPTKDSNKDHQNLIKQIINVQNKVIYLDGWNFRNPVGLKKYRNQIIKILMPKKEILQRVTEFLQTIRKSYFLVGVHIRQGEYKSKNWDWYFYEGEVAEILKYFLKIEKKDSKKVLFVLVSDNKLNLSFFSGLNVKVGIGNMMEDLITLSMCNLIIGSNSTFGSFAAYFGNIPFFIFDRKKGCVRGKGVNLFQN